MFEKVLIANRGEIAVRIIKTARRLGILTVAVYATQDADCTHVHLADVAYELPGRSAKETYLNQTALKAIIERSGCDAVHPGYGFLSENASFASLCADLGCCFIGPTANAIALMGSKSAAKQVMQQAGVPLLPGYHGEQQSCEAMLVAAEKIGFPVMLKAALGGGGKGMAIVHESGQFAAQFAKAQREAMASCGDSELLIEKYLSHPRHIEVQVFADKLGQTIHLYERDCSIQRRHQKIIEEAPAVGIDTTLRAALGDAAVAAAKAIDYVGAGTVEFLIDQAHNFYFMEMNTRLQVEHPVTEKITGLDLVEWQFLVAQGKPLPLSQHEIPLRGHAIEARIYAEDTENQFLPAIGKIFWLSEPEQSQHIRVDSGIGAGDEISIYFDPMMSKMIAWDENRTAAISRLTSAISQYQLLGVKNNIHYLQQVLHSDAFKQGKLTTQFVELYQDDLVCIPTSVSIDCLAVAACYHLSRAQQDIELSTPWHQVDGWRLNADSYSELQLRHDKKIYFLQIKHEFPRSFTVQYLEQFSRVVVQACEQNHLRIALDGQQVSAQVIPQQNMLHLFFQGQQISVEIVKNSDTEKLTEEQGSLQAPMPGTIVNISVATGQSVKSGDPLVIIEAMKMEHTISSPVDGVVEKIFFKQGELVEEGVQLLHLTALDDQAEQKNET